jgi:cytidine deaminase
MPQPDYTELITVAMTARERAYVPYSRFAVGAAVLTASGAIFPGCNIENAAYPVTLCAERVALFGAYAAGERDILAVVVITDTYGPALPCGACRQVLIELAPHSVLLLHNLRGAEHMTTPAELLPLHFGSTQLDEAAQSSTRPDHQ